MNLVRAIKKLAPKINSAYLLDNESLLKILANFQINTKMRIVYFISQMHHESGGFRFLTENLNYSAERLRQVFPKYFKTLALAQAYEHRPVKIANRVYANRLGNGNEASGDGFKYRGHGIIQLTGKANYAEIGKKIGIDLVNNPDLASSGATAWIIASQYWHDKALNGFADKNDLSSITRKINGGLNGYHDRKFWFNKYFTLL